MFLRPDTFPLAKDQPDTFRYILPERRLWLYVHFTGHKRTRYPALHRIRVFKGTKVVIQLIKVVIRQRSVGVMAERVGGTGAGASVAEEKA